MNKTIIAIAALCFSAIANAGPVNINTADAETLDAELNGVGPVTSQRIVEYREQNGPFESADELMQVSGVGEKTLEKNIEDIRVD